MSLDLAEKKLGWPSRAEILNPSGKGAEVFARLAQAKIGGALARQPGAAGAKVGVLSPNPQGTATEPPLAVVCEFQRSLPDPTLREMQKLAWNFSHCPMLVTVEPHLLRAWTCCEPPGDKLLTEFVVHEISASDLSARNSLSTRAAQVLHWVNLVSGQFFKDNATRFRRDQRADQLLLENLRFVRQALREAGLENDDVCHDLLARIIFIQFLSDRKDSSGKAALNAGRLERLHTDDILKARHSNFASILGYQNETDETYRLFAWLNERFNGDLFPGKGQTGVERECALQAEKRLVKPEHLAVLEQFISGRLDMPKGQRSLWREYAFDAIPLEFISSIYEAFVSERARSDGIYYTPPHLVDFVLDRVLPWDGDGWNLKILDPACGSGVFLVKAFQRLIHRWKKAHPREDLRAGTLRGLLENNLFGVDKDPHAVRVASFSLYLAMCDEIDPKHYWTQIHFPPMRECRLINADFFAEDIAGFRTIQDAASYDRVVGNAPSGDELLTKTAKDWAKNPKHKWPVANKGIGTLFLPKAAALAKPDGKVAMIQSASSLLFNRSGPACEFREKFFTTFQVEEVVNLSALRFKVFNKKKGSAQKAVAPACVVTFTPTPPTGGRLLYVSPKFADDSADEFEIVVEPADVKAIHPDDGAKDAEVWTAMMWGNGRDLALVRRLARLPSLKTLEDEGRLKCREGIIRGENPTRRDEYTWLLNRHILEADSFPSDGFLHLNADELPRNKDAWAERPRSESIFTPPQLLIKQGWSVRSKRYQARLVIPDKQGLGALCTQSFLSVSSIIGEELLLEAACLACNSSLAVYFLLLTSGRFASYRPEALAKEIPRIPVPEPRPGLLDGLKSAKDIDRRVQEMFGLKTAEIVLVEDLCGITLEDFKGDESSPGRQRTKRRLDSVEEPQLRQYCDYFIRVLKAGFGQDKGISATIFQENGTNLFPFRLVAFQLDHVATPQVQSVPLEASALLAELETLNHTWLKTRKTKGGSIYHERVARIYDQRGKVSTIFIIKPDACRYWTRSMGLHDADEVAADLHQWQTTANNGGNRRRRE